MSPWLIYFILKLDCITALSGIILTISLMAGVLIFLYFSLRCHDEDSAEEQENLIKHRNSIIKKILIIIIISFIFFTFIPTTKETALIYIIPKIQNSQAGKSLVEIPPLIEKYIESELNKEQKDE